MYFVKRFPRNLNLWSYTVRCCVVMTTEKFTLNGLLSFQKLKINLFSLQCNTSLSGLMMRKLIFLILCAFSFNAFGLQEAPVLVLEEGKEFYEVGLHLDILEDPTKKLSIHDVNKPEWAKKFKKSENKVPNFGFSNSAFWARLRVKNNSESNKKWFFTQNYFTQDYITFYKKDRGFWESVETGDFLPFRTKEIESRTFTFKMQPENESVYFIKIMGITNRMNFTITSPEELFSGETKNNLILGIFFGLVFAMVAFNSFVYFTTKSTSNILYVLYLFFYGVFIATIQGYGHRFIFPDTAWMLNNGVAIQNALTQIFMCLFTMSFLRLKEASPRLNNLLKFIIFANVLLILSSLIFDFSINYKFIFVNVSMLFPTIFFVGVYRSWMGDRPAKYYLLSFSFMLLGVALFVFMIVGALPINFWTRYSILLGNAAQIIILSMGLADQFKKLQEEALHKEEEAARNLQREVDRQTIELRSKTEQLEDLDQKKTSFFQNISHELRTPLTLIMNPLETIQKRYKDDEDVIVANKNSKRLYRLLNQLLDFQKLSAGKKELTLNKLNLVSFIHTCGDMFRSSCTLKEIDFRLTLNNGPFNADSVPVFVKGEIDALEKIVFNYLSNALKYSPIKSKITLGLEKSEGEVKISVTDEGKGISKENQAKLFQVFSQVDESVTREYEGTGLGLALVKDLATHLKGEVGVESEEGKGSTFWIKIPEYGHNSIDILAVDEDTSFYKNLKLEAGKTFKVVASSLEAKKIIQTHDVKSILFDGQLVKDNSKLIDWSHEFSPDSKKVIISSQIQKEEFDNVFKIISKDLKRTEFLKEIESLLVTEKEADLTDHQVRDWHLSESSEADHTHEESTNEEVQKNGKELVLIVDDLKDMRDLISRTLKKNSYQILTAVDGQQGMEMAKKFRPDLIITDWMMPKMSGPEMIKSLKGQTELGSIPIILLTAKSDEESKMLGIEIGADGFLGKPFNDQEMLSLVRNLLSLKSREKEVEELNHLLTENVLKRYLPPDLVEQIISGETSLDQKPETIAGTILFSDIVGFTSLSGKLRANKLARLLNEYLTEMVQIIYKHGGTVDKFIGDAIMVIFGAPKELLPKDQAYRAAACAKEMQEKMLELNANWQNEGIPNLKMRIGIHQGPLVVGTFGCPERSDYTSIGPTVNIASRIESACEPGEVFISGELCDFLPEEMTEMAGMFELKGLTGEQYLYRLIQ